MFRWDPISVAYRKRQAMRLRRLTYASVKIGVDLGREIPAPSNRDGACVWLLPPLFCSMRCRFSLADRDGSFSLRRAAAFLMLLCRWFVSCSSQQAMTPRLFAAGLVSVL